MVRAEYVIWICQLFYPIQPSLSRVSPSPLNLPHFLNCILSIADHYGSAELLFVSICPLEAPSYLKLGTIGGVLQIFKVCRPDSCRNKMVHLQNCGTNPRIHSLSRA
jgi:hypothetical protein